MTLECIVFIIGVIVQITSKTSWAQFAVGRLISGFGVGSLSAAVPMYQAETAPPQIRGTLTATYQLFITFGILVACKSTFRSKNLLVSQSFDLISHSPSSRLYFYRHALYLWLWLLAHGRWHRLCLARYLGSGYLVHARISKVRQSFCLFLLSQTHAYGNL